MKNRFEDTDIHFGRSSKLLKLAKKHGVNFPKQFPPNAAVLLNQSRIDFIENKLYDFDRIREILSLSITANQHANWGPVTRLLEDVVKSVISLKPNQQVIAVSSGTSALHLCACYIAMKHKIKKPRWVVSSFGFFSTVTQQLAESLVIDCDELGRLDFDLLKQIPLSDYDGVIYTNVFAQHSNWLKLANFCADNEKTLLIDNATGLWDRPECHRTLSSPLEIISAHHTKPWGCGEGGFIICEKKDELNLRCLANFGRGLERTALAHSSNFKLSDVAAAAIIDRIERWPVWSKEYALQESRLRELIPSLNDNFKIFEGTTTPISARAHTPFISKFPISLGTKNGSGRIINKYYKPLKNEFGKIFPSRASQADKIYDRIFSVPNNPEFSKLDDREISRIILNSISESK